MNSDLCATNFIFQKDYDYWNTRLKSGIRKTLLHIRSCNFNICFYAIPVKIIMLYESYFVYELEIVTSSNIFGDFAVFACVRHYLTMWIYAVTFKNPLYDSLTIWVIKRIVWSSGKFSKSEVSLKSCRKELKFFNVIFMEVNLVSSACLMWGSNSENHCNRKQCRLQE